MQVLVNILQFEKSKFFRKVVCESNSFADLLVKRFHLPETFDKSIYNIIKKYTVSMRSVNPKFSTVEPNLAKFWLKLYDNLKLQRFEIWIPVQSTQQVLSVFMIEHC